jgi:hypothetical protein
MMILDRLFGRRKVIPSHSGYAVEFKGELLLGTVGETATGAKANWLAFYSGDYQPDDFTRGGMCIATAFEFYPAAKVVLVSVTKVGAE